MNNELRDAALAGDIDLLYAAIQQNPRVLERVNSIPFVETPLHIAASNGHLQFASEIMILKPSFALKLNPQGLTPVHLALQLGDNRMVLRLVDMNKDLVKTKGREGLTPLHLASQSGDMELLTEFRKACPNSIQCLTVRSETPLHFAVRNRRLESLKFFIRWLQTNTLCVERTILDQKDDDGNTILHVAASNNFTEAIALLIKTKTELDATNSNNLTASAVADIAGNKDTRRTLDRARATATAGRRISKIMLKRRPFILSMKEWVIRKGGMREHMTGETRNAYLVVAVGQQ